MVWALVCVMPYLPTLEAGNVVVFPSTTCSSPVLAFILLLDGLGWAETGRTNEARLSVRTSALSVREIVPSDHGATERLKQGQIEPIGRLSHREWEDPPSQKTTTRAQFLRQFQSEHEKIRAWDRESRGKRLQSARLWFGKSGVQKRNTKAPEKDDRRQSLMKELFNLEKLPLFSGIEKARFTRNVSVSPCHVV